MVCAMVARVEPMDSRRRLTRNNYARRPGRRYGYRSTHGEPTLAGHTTIERETMAQKAATRSRTTAKKTTKTTAKKSTSATKPVDRLDDAIAAAQDALKDLRGDLSKGRRDLVKDMDKILKDARSNLRRVRGTIVEDLGEVGRKLSGSDDAKRKPAARKPAASKRKPAAAKPKPKAKK